MVVTKLIVEVAVSRVEWRSFHVGEPKIGIKRGGFSIIAYLVSVCVGVHV